MFTPKRDERTAVADTSTHAVGITSHPLSQTRLDGFARAAAPPLLRVRDGHPHSVRLLLQASKTLSREITSDLLDLCNTRRTPRELVAGMGRVQERVDELTAMLGALRILLDLRGEP